MSFEISLQRYKKFLNYSVIRIKMCVHTKDLPPCITRCWESNYPAHGIAWAGFSSYLCTQITQKLKL